MSDTAADAARAARSHSGSSNGNAAPFRRDPIEPGAHDFDAWSRGAAALARMPARRVLELTEGIAEIRERAAVEIGAADRRLDRLRYWPEDALDSEIGARLGARVLCTVAGDPPPPLRLGRLDPLGHTILYGTGGVGKGTLATEWTRQLVAEDAAARVLIVDYENHPDEWARRLSGLGGMMLGARILHVPPLAASWKGPRGAVWKQAEKLRDLADAWGATHVVIDSIVPACGAIDPLKPEAAGQYAAALQIIGRPTLSLGHVTKAEQPRYPFGSVFWHNLARVTWSLQADGPLARLVNRKDSNHRHGARFVVSITYLDDLPREVSEKPYQAVLTERILDVLGEGAMTVERIVASLNDDLDEDALPAKPDSVRAALRRNLEGDDRLFDVADKQYSRRRAE